MLIVGRQAYGNAADLGRPSLLAKHIPKELKKYAANGGTVAPYQLVDSQACTGRVW